MNRALANSNPLAADRWQATQTVAALMRETPMMEVVPLDGNSPARRAFVGMTDEIRVEAETEAAERNVSGQKLWGGQ